VVAVVAVIVHLHLILLKLELVKTVDQVVVLEHQTIHQHLLDQVTHLQYQYHKVMMVVLILGLILVEQEVVVLEQLEHL
tara:strand:+ start:142 stop:378 length:237 start_codon:yes stop_codon:yes gene_type:complete